MSDEVIFLCKNMGRWSFFGADSDNEIICATCLIKPAAEAKM